MVEGPARVQSEEREDAVMVGADGCILRALGACLTHVFAMLKKGAYEDRWTERRTSLMGRLSYAGRPRPLHVYYTVFGHGEMRT